MDNDEATAGKGSKIGPGVLFEFPKRPDGLLYHYASLESFEKIARSKKLWASELHYLNDASEIRYFGQIVIDEARRRLEIDATNVDVLTCP